MKSFQNIKAGLILSVLAMLCGFVMGGVFGANEEVIKSKLKNSGAENIETVYQGDAEKMKSVVDKSWKYMIRAHLHWGVMGIGALAVCLLIAFVGNSVWEQRGIALFIGLGACMYGAFWMMAGFAAPALGSTGAGKEAYGWLGWPGAGMYILATFWTIKNILFYKPDLSQPN